MDKGQMGKLKIEFLLLMCSYGCLGPVVRGISLPTVMIVWARALISPVTLLIFILMRRKHWRECKSYLLPMIISGVFLAIDWIGLFASYQFTTIATATLCYYSVSILVMVGAAVFLKEKLFIRQIICIAVAFIGMSFVSGVAEGGIPALSEIKGVLFGLLGAAGYAGVILINKKAPDGDPILRTFLQLITSAMLMSLYVLRTVDFHAFTFDAKDVLLLLMLGVLMTAVAYIAYFSLIVRIPSSSVAFFSYADPVTAVLISLLFLREPFSWYTLIGGILIVGAAAAAELPLRRKSED